MMCLILAIPSPCDRYKGTRELFDSDKYEISQEGNKYILVVNDVFGEDADEYCIRASNSAGSRSSRADLTIRCKYHFENNVF